MGDGIAGSLASLLTEWGLPLAVASQALAVAQQRKAYQRVQQQQQAYADADRARRAEASATAQKAFESESLPAFDAGNIEKSRKEQEAKINAANAAPSEASAVAKGYQQAAATSAPVVGDTIANRLNSGLSVAQDSARRAALAQSFAASRSAANTTAGRAGEDIGAAARSASRGTKWLPYQLESAKMSGLKDRTIADAIGGLGQLAGLFALTRPPAPVEERTWGK